MHVQMTCNLPDFPHSPHVAFYLSLRELKCWFNLTLLLWIGTFTFNNLIYMPLSMLSYSDLFVKTCRMNYWMIKWMSLALVQFFSFCSVDTTRVSFTIPLRESFGFPVLFAQIALITFFFKKDVSSLAQVFVGIFFSFNNPWKFYPIHFSLSYSRERFDSLVQEGFRKSQLKQQTNVRVSCLSFWP